MHRSALVVIVAALAACSGAAVGPASEDDSNESGGTGATGATGGRGAAGGNRAGGPAKAGSMNAAGHVSTGSGGSGGTAGRSSVSSAGQSSASGGAGDDEAGNGGTNGSTGGAVGAAGASGVPSNHTNPLSQDLMNAFVKAHNDARAGQLVPAPSTPLPPVSWDAVLADSAYNYLSHCESSDGSLVDHNDNRTKDYAALGGSGYVGENIFASSASSVAPADAVSSWMSEASQYVPGDVNSAGHYTQVVWRDSVRIGCAIVNCPSVRFHNTVLCNYAPGGNVSGQMPY